MNTKSIIYQRPYPRIVFKDPDTGETVKTKAGFLEFSTENNKNLISYQFTLSANDISGSFSLTLYPDYKDKNGTTYSFYDDIKKLQIVEIYESDGGNNEKPVFIGIVKRRKYIAQVTDDGGMRRMSVSGYSVAGLVSQFYVNLDTAAIALTKQLAGDVALSKDLTIQMGSKKNLEVKECIKTIWEYFEKISSQNGTPKVGEYIKKFMGDVDNFFDVDDSKFFYPLGCVFNGQQTQDFFSVIDGIIPSPVYEKFAYADIEKGQMKIKIRTVPFDSDKWSKLKTIVLSPVQVKNIDLEDNDDEVYTVFYAYLNGYPVDEQKNLILSTMEAKQDKTLVDSEKYKIYGYRPLIAHFYGYGLKDGEKDTDSATQMQKITKKLKEWFGNLPDMLKGSFTLAMNYTNNLIQPGCKIKFLSGEFYVEGVTHSWNYGAGGEINIAVSRGGKYEGGKFKCTIENLTSILNLLKKGIDPDSKRPITIKR